MEDLSSEVCDEDISVSKNKSDLTFRPPLFCPTLACENISGVDTLTLELIQQEFTTNLTHVTKLVVTQTNTVRTIANDIFTSMPALEEIDLRGNKLVSVPHTIQTCTNLKILKLDGNRLTFLPSTLKNCRNIQELSVSQNQLRSFNPSLFDSLHDLRILAADNNLLISLPHTITHAQKLKTINLRNNPLRTLPPSLFTIPTLVQVSLDWLRFCAPPLPRKITGQDLLQVTQTLNDRLSDEVALADAIVRAGYQPKRFGVLTRNGKLRRRYSDVSIKDTEQENIVPAPDRTQEEVTSTAPTRCVSQSDPGCKQWPDQLPCFATIVLLSKRSVRVSAIDKAGRTRLHVASAEGNVGMVDALIRAGAEVDALDEQGFSPLLHAVRGENWQCAERLLRGGAQPDCGGGIFGSSLHVAAVNTDVEITSLLLKYRASANFQDRDGNTPLHVLFSVFDTGGDRSVAIALLLLMRGAICNIKGQDGWSPLHLAARRNQVHAFGFVADCLALARRQSFIRLPIQPSQRTLALSSKFDINLRGGQQLWTPLHLAAHAGLSRIVVKLVEMGANVLATNSNLKTARDVASGQLETTKVLLRAERQWLFWKVCGGRRLTMSEVACPDIESQSPLFDSRTDSLTEGPKSTMGNSTPLCSVSSDADHRLIARPSRILRGQMSLQLAETLLTPRTGHFLSGQTELSPSGAAPTFVRFSRMPISKVAPMFDTLHETVNDDELFSSRSPMDDLQKLSIELASFIDPFLPLDVSELEAQRHAINQAQDDMINAEARFFRTCIKSILRDPLGLGSGFHQEDAPVEHHLSNARPVIVPQSLLPPSDSPNVDKGGVQAPLTARTARIVRPSVGAQDVAEPTVVRGDVWPRGVTRLRNKTVVNLRAEETQPSSVLRVADQPKRSDQALPNGVAHLLRQMAVLYSAANQIHLDYPELRRLDRYRLAQIVTYEDPTTSTVMESLDHLLNPVSWRSSALVPMPARLHRFAIWLMQPPVIAAIRLAPAEDVLVSRPSVPPLPLGGKGGLKREMTWPALICEVLMELANVDMEDAFVYILASMPMSSRSRLAGCQDAFGCSILSRLLHSSLSSKAADKFCRIFLHLCPNLAEHLDHRDPNDALRAPLHIAAKRGLLHSTQLLLLRGADVNVKDATGNTALHLAVWSHQPCVAISLLYHPKVDLQASDSVGRTPLDLAIEVGGPQLVAMLINRGASVSLMPGHHLHLPNCRNSSGLGEFKFGQSILGRASQIHDSRLSQFLSQLLLSNGVDPPQLNTFEMLKVNAVADRCLKHDVEGPRGPIQCMLYLGMPLGPASATRVRGTSTHKQHVQYGWTITRNPISCNSEDDFINVHPSSTTRCVFPDTLGSVCLFCSGGFWHSSVVGNNASARSLLNRTVVSPRVLRRRPSTSKRRLSQPQPGVPINFKQAVFTCRSCSIPLCEDCAIMASRLTAGAFPLLEDLPRQEQTMLLFHAHPGAAHDVYRVRHSVGAVSSHSPGPSNTLSCGIAGRRLSTQTQRKVPRLIVCRRGLPRVQKAPQKIEALDVAIDRAISDAPEDVLVVLGIANGRGYQVDLDIEWDDSTEDSGTWGSLGGLAKSGLRFECSSSTEDWADVVTGLRSAYRRLVADNDRGSVNKSNAGFLGLCTPRVGQVRRPRPPSWSRRCVAESTALQGILFAAESYSDDREAAREPLILCATCACHFTSLPLRYPLKMDPKRPHLLAQIETGAALTFRYRRQLRTDGVEVIPVATL